MAAIGYYLFYGISWIITLLPLRILYVFSYLLFILMYYFPGYRRKVVAQNLKNSFHEKNPRELAMIGKKFYHHFCDLFPEVLKLQHMSEKELMKRISFTNPELADRLYDDGRDVVAILGHYCNWEWLSGVPLFVKHQMVSVYKPLQNKHFDKFMNDLRARNRMILVPMQQIAREIIVNRKNGKRTIYAFITDQTPSISDVRYWTSFLNQDTPVYLGAEKLAAKYDMPVVFVNVRKIKRGYYSMTAELLFDHPAGLPEYAVTEAHVRRLEEVIRQQPEYWLWSHRRWKHKKESP
ncbi:MAG: lysophospholipid acyltransferase family protein [Bacteroidales bacterium]|nr:lysophospholipid acyltransferase family protein [Bacteroidales bacterium]